MQLDLANWTYDSWRKGRRPEKKLKTDMNLNAHYSIHDHILNFKNVISLNLETFDTLSSCELYREIDASEYEQRLSRLSEGARDRLRRGLPNSNFDFRESGD